MGTSVTLETPRTDTYSRRLSRVLRHAPGDPARGLDVNLEMVRLGAAVPVAFCRPTSRCTLNDFAKARAPSFAAACREAKAAGRPGGIFDARSPLLEAPYELRDRAWDQQKEVVWVGDVLTGKYVPYEDRGRIDVCNRVAFALTTVNGRAEEKIPGLEQSGNPEQVGFKALD